MAEWFYSTDGATQHSASWDELKQLAAQGILRPQHLVWRAGLKNWVKAGAVKGLFPAAPTSGENANVRTSPTSHSIPTSSRRTAPHTSQRTAPATPQQAAPNISQYTTANTPQHVARATAQRAAPATPHQAAANVYGSSQHVAKVSTSGSGLFRWGGSKRTSSKLTMSPAVAARAAAQQLAAQRAANAYAAPKSRSVSRNRLAYAGFWLRAIAWIIDWALLMGGTFVLALWLNEQADSEPLQPMDSLEFLRAVQQGASCLSFFYYPIMEASPLQATIGKLLLGLKVTNMKRQRASLFRTMGRHLGKILSGCTFGIGYLMAAFTEEKQALHDIVAGTLVLRRW